MWMGYHEWTTRPPEVFSQDQSAEHDNTSVLSDASTLSVLSYRVVDVEDVGGGRHKTS
jgi:hypothetical protein